MEENYPAMLRAAAPHRHGVLACPGGGTARMKPEPCERNRVHAPAGPSLPHHSMILRLPCFLLLLCGALSPGLHAATPPLLAKAVAQWVAGREDLAFTQHSRFFDDDGKVKEERVERYDPSLPDSRRWRLLAVDGRPASVEQRVKWETVKNGKPRKKAMKAPGEYLDLDHAKLLDETDRTARFEIALRTEAARLLAVEKIAVVITVDKESGGVSHIAAKLRQPIRVLMGLARITGLDIDVDIDPSAGDAVPPSGEVKSGSTARVTMSKLGNPMEYRWSNFRRVTTYRAP